MQWQTVGHVSQQLSEILTERHHQGLFRGVMPKKLLNLVDCDRGIQLQTLFFSLLSLFKWSDGN